MRSDLVGFAKDEHRVEEGEAERGQRKKRRESTGKKDRDAVARLGSTKFTIHIAAGRIFKPLIKGATRMGWRTGYSQM